MWEIMFKQNYRRRGYDIDSHKSKEVTKDEYKEMEDMYSVLK